jgi:alkaline phosphatase D
VTFSSFPFTLGVASGDPTPTGVVLWTRLAPDPLHGGGMSLEDIEVAWEVATDERMGSVVQRGTTVAPAALGHSVHVEVDQLEPNRWYWYRFSVGTEESPVGRTRTIPADHTAAASLRYAFASCQHYEQGYFTAYQHMAHDDLDLVFHLGDYIYEYAGRDDRVRAHTGDEIELLDDYRNRYALYRTDPDLQAAHAAFPWVVTWDDHEVDNNYAASISEDGLPAELFERRRRVAYQAYYEHMPLRRASMPRESRMQLYRNFRWGDLASFFVLDTRQYRTDQPCGDRSGPTCDGMLDPDATPLGETQERWLMDGLDRSTTRWNVIPQQIMMARVDRMPGDTELFGMDIWSGYEVARRRLMEFLATRRPANPIVLTGDIHSNWVNDLKVDYENENAPVVGTEFVGTSISSGGDGVDTQDSTAAMLLENPWVKFFNAQRGYVRCSVTADQCVADYLVLDYVTRPGSPISTRASFVVESGRPGAQRL